MSVPGTCSWSVIVAPPPGFLSLMIYFLLPFLMLTVVVIASVWTYRHKKPQYGHVDISEVHTHNTHTATSLHIESFYSLFSRFLFTSCTLVYFLLTLCAL